MTTWFFDFDGVLLDSNAVKTYAFTRVTQPYGQLVADDVVQHHITNGGESRFVKFHRLFAEVLKRAPLPGEMEGLLKEFGKICSAELMACRTDPAAYELFEQLSEQGDVLHVVSGGLEAEVSAVLVAKGLAPYLQSINGSPRSKDEILNDLGAMACDDSGVFVGDSEGDMRVALDFGLRRVFITQWTEFATWSSYAERNTDITVCANLSDLMSRIDTMRLQ